MMEPKFMLFSFTGMTYLQLIRRDTDIKQNNPKDSKDYRTTTLASNKLVLTRFRKTLNIYFVLQKKYQK